MIGCLKNEKGIALFIVLWVLMLLGAIVAEFSYAVKLRLNIVKNFKDSTQSYYFAVSGVHNAIASLLEKKEGPGNPESEDFMRDIESLIREGDVKGGYSANIGNESGKVNINTADDNLLQVMFSGVEIDAEQKKVIVDSIMDWRDENSLHRINGAEDDYYLSLENPYECRDDEFQSKEELLLVRGISREIFAGIKDMITIYSTSKTRKSNIFAQGSGKSNSSRININFAPKKLLTLLPTMTDELVDRIIVYRNEKMLQSINELQAIVGMDGYTAINRYLTISESVFFSIDSFGFTENSHSKSIINAMIEISPKFENEYRFIQWKEG